MIITIDGPAGSGKSTVAKELAKELKIYYLYTGLLYRAVAYIWLNKLNKKLEDLDSAISKDFKFISKISYEYYESNPEIFYEGERLTPFLNQTTLDQSASILSAKKEVRVNLLEIQQNVAKNYDIVADGRDCGSVVFPDADYKFFLTASLEIRAKRILSDKNRGENVFDLEKVKEELEQRDERDKKREVSPLIVPDNAIIIDNSDMTKEETIREFLEFIKS